MRVLLVEDDVELREVIAEGLRSHAIAVDIACDGDEALFKADITGYDVIVLDRALPRVHGDEVCRELSAQGSGARILMLTASVSLEDRVEGFALGADDYLPKPYELPELVARVRALARRSVSLSPPVLTTDDLVLEPARHLVWRGDRELRLTPKEFGVLETLMAAAGRFVSAEELLERVWDEHADPFTNAIRITVMTLRRKLGDPPLIETRKGVGYRVMS